MNEDTAFLIVRLILDGGWFLWFAGAFTLACVILARAISREWADVLRMSAPFSVSILYWWLIVNKYAGSQLLYAHEILLLGFGYVLFGAIGLTVAAQEIFKPSK